MKEENLIRELIDRFLRTEHSANHAFIVDGDIYELTITRSISTSKTYEILDRVVKDDKPKS